MPTNSDSDRLAYWLLKDVNKAIRDYAMIADGDRVAVAVSGGKDSLSLLRLLDLRQRQVPERYELAAIHVIGDARGPQTPCHQPLLDWLAANSYRYQVVRAYLPAKEALPLACHRCTWNRRRTLFEAAKQLSCNVVALGHHADDLAQTTLLNLLFHGVVETMAPRRGYFNGALRLIRPLCYVPEKELRRFAQATEFPPPPERCPRSHESQRQVTAGLLRQAQQYNRRARVNLLRAGLRSYDTKT